MLAELLSPKLEVNLTLHVHLRNFTGVEEHI
jgi:hypothetical protein